MKEFQEYLPNAWQVDGLTIAPKVAPKKWHDSARLNHQVKAIVAACAIGIAISGLNIQMSTSSIQASNLADAVYGQVNPLSASIYSGVPSGYWVQLVAALRSAPMLPDDSSFDGPAPLI